MTEQVEIISFYEFKDMSPLGDLAGIKAALRQLMLDLDIRGTIILAAEGFNGMICGIQERTGEFVSKAGKVLDAELRVKSSLHDTAPFRRLDVQIKPEIVTLKRPVDITLGQGTHVKHDEWNDLISDPETFVLDTRNDYEFQTGTFDGAVNPGIDKFSDLPAYIAANIDPEQYKRVAMFCTGGIRCEKFVPYMKQIGFDEVYQLEGGILKYLEETDPEESLWQGECFVFDERVTVNASLKKGEQPDHSQRLQQRKNPAYKTVE